MNRVDPWDVRQLELEAFCVTPPHLHAAIGYRNCDGARIWSVLFDQTAAKATAGSLTKVSVHTLSDWTNLSSDSLSRVKNTLK